MDKKPTFTKEEQWQSAAVKFCAGFPTEALEKVTLKEVVYELREAAAALDLTANWLAQDHPGESDVVENIRKDADRARDFLSTLREKNDG